MMQPLHGPVLTYAPSLAYVSRAIKDGGYNSLKVVTAWGIDGGWTENAMRYIGGLVDKVLVRTAHGDPRSSRPYLYDNDVEQEVAPWIRVLGKKVIVELGNEPNIAEIDPYAYNYHLDKAITRMRFKFPGTLLISPALIIGADYDDAAWLNVIGPQIARCDYVGIHAYEHVSLHGKQPSTGQFERAYSLHNQFVKPLMLTEYGVNDKKISAWHKGEAYRLWFDTKRPANVAGAFYYHICADGAVDPQYHISPLGDRAYGKKD